LKIGYDDSLGAMAPGNLLMEQLLDRLCKDSVTEANLVSDASWHRSWNPHSYHTRTYFVGNRTARGLSLVLLLRLRNRIREFQERRAAARAAKSATVAGTQEEASPQELPLELRESFAQR
jgi:CelD/BcsL family acetyltransferase involved in cellulose biosynthesis